MRTSMIVRSLNRDLAFELFRVLCNEWRAIIRQDGIRRTAKKIAGYLIALLAISLAVNVMISAPSRDSARRYPGHQVVNGLHIAVPENLRGFAIEQLVPLP
jgi:hypothetical protein